MPAQTTIPSKIINHYRWRTQDIPRENQIYTTRIHKSSPTENTGRKTPTQGSQLHSEKHRQYINSLYQKSEIGGKLMHNTTTENKSKTNKNQQSMVINIPQYQWS